MYVDNKLRIPTSGISMLTERVADGTIVVTYCPTKEMVSDYLSKPLQDSLFRDHRNTLMGITPAIDIQYKLLYTKNKVLKAKEAKDHLSV